MWKHGHEYVHYTVTSGHLNNYMEIFLFLGGGGAVRFKNIELKICKLWVKISYANLQAVGYLLGLSR